jgi:hypothetical protein
MGPQSTCANTTDSSNPRTERTRGLAGAAPMRDRKRRYDAAGSKPRRIRIAHEEPTVDHRRMAPDVNDAVVVGGGLAGLSCALALANAGMRVCVLEAADALGGRAQLGARAERRRGRHRTSCRHERVCEFPGAAGPSRHSRLHRVAAGEVDHAGTVRRPVPARTPPVAAAAQPLTLRDKLSNVPPTWRTLTYDESRLPGLDDITALELLRACGTRTPARLGGRRPSSALEPGLVDASRFEPSPYKSVYLWFDRRISRERFWALLWAPDCLNYDSYDLGNIRPSMACGPSVIASNSIYSHRARKLTEGEVVAATVKEIAMFAPEARRATVVHATFTAYRWRFPTRCPASNASGPA